MKPRFIVFSYGPYPPPQAGLVKEIPELRNVSDDEVQKSVERVSERLAWTETIEPEPTSPADDSAAGEHPGNDNSEDEMAEPLLTTDHIAFLQEIQLNPWRLLTEHREALGWRSGALAQRILDDVIKGKFALAHGIQVGRARTKAMESTEAGHEVTGLEKGSQRIKGKFPHRWVIRRFVIPFFESQDYEVKVESDGADVVAHKPETGERVAVEVELRDSEHVIENVQRDFRETGCDRILIAVEKKAIQKKVQVRLDAADDLAEDRNKVEVVLLSHFRQ